MLLQATGYLILLGNGYGSMHLGTKSWNTEQVGGRMQKHQLKKTSEKDGPEGWQIVKEGEWTGEEDDLEEGSIWRKDPNGIKDQQNGKMTT